ncbi:WhiB family transcriptional regulator [Streptomyces murinus]|uniref:WhiB family transcriptional regulator n=1 Tax=Streptomyces murinus TaxID=33900 RepID=UPI00380E943B
MNYLTAARHELDWRLQGTCSTHPEPDIWHATGATTQTRADLEEAKALCLRCPVQETCMNWALNNREAYGLWGGLTEGERRRILRIRIADGDAEPRKGGRPLAPCGTPSAYDRHIKLGEPVDDACRGAHTRASAEKRERVKQKPGSLKELFKAHTRRLYGGHLAWTGPTKPSFQGRSYNPKQVAFIIDRGREPVGRVLNDCAVRDCVLPAHVADDSERTPCGTRYGYQRHRKNGEDACNACRQANSDADNRLRRTGSTKQLAA